MKSWNKLDINNLPPKNTLLVVKVRGFGIMTGQIKLDVQKAKFPFFKDIYSEPYLYNHYRSVKYSLDLVEGWRYPQVTNIFSRKLK